MEKLFCDRFNIKSCSNLLTISCFYIFSFYATSAIATTYYISTTGSNLSNSGTSINSPWRTIQKGVNMAVAGDTVYIEAGDYGNEKIKFQNSGTLNSPIQFIGYKNTPGDINNYNYTLGSTNLDSDEMPLLDGGDRATGGVAFNLNKLDYSGADYITIKNMLIKNYQSAVIGGNIEYCTFENIIAVQLGNSDDSYNGRGIAIGAGANNNVISNCTVSNSAAEGISVLGNHNTIENCKSYCNEGVLSTDYAATDYYLLIKGNYNYVVDCYVERDGDLAHSGHGLKLKGNSEFNLVKDCVVVNQFCFNVAYRGVKNNTFENCLAINGPAGFGITDGASENTFKNCRAINVGIGVIFVDTIEDEEYEYVGMGNGDYVIIDEEYVAYSGGDYISLSHADGAGHDNTFINCIFEDITYEAISFYFDSNKDYYLANEAFDNTFIYCNFIGANYFFKCNLENYGNDFVNCIVTNISNLKYGSEDLIYTIGDSCFDDNGFSTPGGNNFDADPEFVDSSAGDYRLKACSPCIDAGRTYGLGYDYNYLARPYNSSYDVGAHEYIAKDPVIYLKFTDGATTDEMGNISSGTKNGTSIYSSGQDGTALNFDGVDDNIDFGKPSLLDINNACTISAWIKPDTNGTCNFIAGKYTWGYSLFTSGGYLCGYVAGATSPANSKSSIPVITTGEWQHVAMTFDYNGDKKAHLYLNGVEISSYLINEEMAGTPASTSAYEFTIGSDFPATNRYYFDGCIDEVKVYERALTAAEIFSEANAVFSADLNEKIGNLANDATIYGNDGTIYGATWVSDGKYCSALRFDGMNDYVDTGTYLANIDNYGGSNGSVTITAWVKPDDVTRFNFLTRYIGGFYYFSVGATGASGVLKCMVWDKSLNGGAGGNLWPTSNGQVAPDSWTHVAFVLEAGVGCKFYINGDLDTTITNSNLELHEYSSTSFIGKGITSGYFGGSIDEIKIYNKALSANEISTLYQSY